MEIGFAVTEVALTILITWMIWQEIGFGSRQEKATNDLVSATTRQVDALTLLAEKENQAATSLSKMNEAIQAEERSVKTREDREAKEAARRPVMKMISAIKRVNGKLALTINLLPPSDEPQPVTDSFETYLSNDGDAPLDNGMLTIYSDIEGVVLSCSTPRGPCGTVESLAYPVAIGFEVGKVPPHASTKIKIKVESKTGMPHFKVHVIVGGDNILPQEVLTIPLEPLPLVRTHP